MRNCSIGKLNANVIATKPIFKKRPAFGAKILNLNGAREAVQARAERLTGDKSRRTLELGLQKGILHLLHTVGRAIEGYPALHVFNYSLDMNGALPDFEKISKAL